MNANPAGEERSSSTVSRGYEVEGLNDVNGVWKTDKDELHSFQNLFAEKRLGIRLLLRMYISYRNGC
ncbi:hypothetical protein AQUCO_02300089v1 [Aquilegia coerulea]|uniref:Uncharacterized protein n=1 Tax=Aquilegia coerulea TaxID=218851 RepID=A0A2G5DBZ7_AQUCA|nr:hypothetical protein AQUCO_02300089v1 [Aquilegia coerulea]